MIEQIEYKGAFNGIEEFKNRFLNDLNKNIEILFECNSNNDHRDYFCRNAFAAKTGANIRRVHDDLADWIFSSEGIYDKQIGVERGFGWKMF